MNPPPILVGPSRSAGGMMSRMPRRIDPHGALIYTIVLVSAAEGDITDPELEMMTGLVKTLPAFKDFDRARIASLGQECVELLRDSEGIDVALDMIADALSPPLRETAYALACDVVAADERVAQSELNLLDMIRHRLEIDRLIAAAIERTARIRYRRL